MPDAFVIMQIGDADLDRVYRDAIAPALMACGLNPRRIDQDNEGGLLNAEIMASIERSDIIVADLTNERPNCYLEVGYALGLGRQRNLVLTVREDHLPGHPAHVAGRPKVHFDLAGYSLVLWRSDDLPALQAELELQIRRRLALLAGTRPSEAGFEPESPWFAEARSQALESIRGGAGRGYMEAHLSVEPPAIQRSQKELLDAAVAAQITTFGWPIGLVLSSENDRPRPTGSSIRATVDSTRIDGEKSFDFWELRTDGGFFMIHSLFEDQRGQQDALFFDTRILRITEALLYAGRLYDRLGVPADRTIHVTVRHGGLQGRRLAAANAARHLSVERQTDVEEIAATTSFLLGELTGQLVDQVKGLAAPLFEVFDFFELGDDVYRSLVDGFVGGHL